MSTKASLLKHAAEFRKAAELYEAMAEIFPADGGPAVQHAQLDGPTFVPTDAMALFLGENLGKNNWNNGPFPRIATKSVYGLTVRIERWT